MHLQQINCLALCTATSARMDQAFVQTNWLRTNSSSPASSSSPSSTEPSSPLHLPNMEHADLLDSETQFVKPSTAVQPVSPLSCSNALSEVQPAVTASAISKQRIRSRAAFVSALLESSAPARFLYCRRRATGSKCRATIADRVSAAKSSIANAPSASSSRERSGDRTAGASRSC